MKVLGIEQSDGERCDCCGTPCPKRRVALDNGFEVRKFGVSCAALALTGSKGRKPSNQVLKEAQAKQFAADHGEKFTEKFGEKQGLEKLAAQLRTRFCNATVVCGKLFVGSELEGKTNRQLQDEALGLV